ALAGDSTMTSDFPPADLLVLRLAMLPASGYRSLIVGWHTIPRWSHNRFNPAWDCIYVNSA
ncbi:MAG: hypothetical protein ACREHD_04390, partial [Pirellulales bacterium]